MLSINRKKLITSLAHKKYREKNGLFLLEGDKVVRDALEQNDDNFHKIQEVYATAEWIRGLTNLSDHAVNLIHEASPEDLEALSTMVTSPGVIALAGISENEFKTSLLKEEYTLVLDSIRDPGNLGTIIRTADWFGIQHVICSPDCVDVFNPKVVQASMGAILRTRIFYEPLSDIITDLKRMRIRVFGTSLSGGNLFDAYIKKPAAIVFGNESKGVSQEVLDLVDEKILIPGDSKGSKGSESLNVASSVAIICAELFRRIN